MDRVYLDYNATSPLLPQAKQAMIEIIEEPLNASSVHAYGQKAKKIIEDTREKLRKLVSAEGFEIIFTSSGTEANNMAIKGFKGENILVSAIEHPSVLKAHKDSSIIPVKPCGKVSIEALRRILQAIDGKSLISVMLANNETGIIQPIKEIVEVAKEFGAVVHVDAVQAFGKMEVNLQDLGADMMTISSHKIGGPQGVAALIARKNISLNPLLTGGGQEKNMRPGTENIAAIYGFSAVMDNLQYHNDIENLRNYLEDNIQEYCQDSVIIGKDEDRLKNTSYITMPEVSSQNQIIYFDMNNIAVSAGSACSSGKVESSHVLRAMEVNPEIANCAIRVSLGHKTCKDDVNKFIDAWKSLYERTRMKKVA
ncbi:cysteine desulfurase [Rickettsiales bacterium]|nr:cysteine desulfurase [Rickettsiales bacterium]